MRPRACHTVVMDQDEELGRRIADLRRARDLRQGDFLELLATRGVKWTQTILSRVEAGKRPLKAIEAFAVAEALRVNVSELNPSSGSLRYDISRIERRYRELADAARESVFNAINSRGQLVALQLAEYLNNGRTEHKVSGSPIQFIYLLAQSLSRDPDPIDNQEFSLVQADLALDVSTEEVNKLSKETSLEEAYRTILSNRFPKLEFTRDDGAMTDWFDVQDFIIYNGNDQHYSPLISPDELFGMLYGG